MNEKNVSWVHPRLRMSLAQRLLLEESLAKKFEELASSHEDTYFLGQQVRFTALDGFIVRNNNRMGILWYHTYDFGPILEKMMSSSSSAVENENDLFPSREMMLLRENDTRFVWIAVTAPLLRFLDDNDYDLFVLYMYNTIKIALKTKRIPTIEDFRIAERESFKDMSKIPPIFRKGEPFQPSAVFHRHMSDRILMLHRIGLPIERPIPLSGTFVLNQYMQMLKLRRALHLAQTKLGSWADESRRIFRVRLSNNLFKTSNYKNTVVPAISILGKKVNVIVISSIFAEKLSLPDLERLIFIEMVEDLTRRKYERAMTLSDALSDLLSETIQRNVKDKIFSVYSEEEIDATRRTVKEVIENVSTDIYKEISVVPISQLS